MPATSPAQERLMQAAAHTHGGYDGVPQSVGKEFTKSDAEPINPQGGAQGRAAGIMFLTKEGETLLLMRGNGGDYPNTFGLPGGHQEQGESLEDTARRETLEETGLDYKGDLTLIHDDGQFATFFAGNVDKFDVQICEESTGFVWASPDAAPNPIHPGLITSFRIAGAKTEYDVAELMKEGLLTSPQPYANMHLLAIRITGTGLAYRSAYGEHVWRDSSLYLNDSFLKRCQGLQVIMDHPEESTLDTKEFKKRTIGSIMLPYIKGDEVWGIARVQDDDAMKQIIIEGNSPEGISTSPNVVFDESAGNTILKTEGGDPLLIEGIPYLMDHIAIVTSAHGSKGVWDKGGEAAGVLLTNQEVSEMSEKINDPKADAQGDANAVLLAAIQGIATSVGALGARMDSMEKNMPAEALTGATDKSKKDADEKVKADAEEKEAKEKKDSDEKAKADAEEKEKKDAEGKAEGKSGEIKSDAKKDEEDDKKAAKADDDEAEYSDAQAKADSVMSGFGKSASRPLNGESLMSYRKRLLRGLQSYSDAYKTINLAQINDAQLLKIAENQIYADAIKAAKSPIAYADGQLIEIHEKDRSGRTITKFRGSIGSWLDDFKVAPQRAMSFNLHNNNQR